MSLKKALIIESKCVSCGSCSTVCQARAISILNGKAVVDQKLCIGCESCKFVCPVEAIEIK